MLTTATLKQPLMHALPPVRLALARLWRTDPPLTAAALVMLAALVAFLAGVAADPRLITGAPAWLKPAKFAASTAIYMLTLAWVFSYLTGWPRVRRAVGWTTAVILVLEVGVIAVQAWRGTTSHFNVATVLDAALFSIMGAGIAVQTLASVWAAVALWRQTFTDRALGLALRAGMTITIVGASTGGLMTRPTEGQLAEAALANRITVIGAHTVGAPDGGPGLPGTGWSLEHGDLRVPHFIGLHALQALPLLAALLGWLEVGGARRTRLVGVGSASYLALFLILLWQALRGQPLVAPDGITVIALMGWAAATGVAATWSFRRTRARIDVDSTLNWINS
jgi:hypothetical protein